MTDKPQFVGKKVTIGELGKTQSGGTPSSKHPEFFNGSIPWIGTTALNGKFLGKNDAVKLITEEAVAKSATKIVPEKSIMVGIRVGVGKVAINAVPMCTSQDIVSIVGIDEASWNKEYISLALQYKAPLLAAQAQGATIAGITSKTLKAIEIPAIPINEQNRVVDILRKLENQVGFVRKQLCGLDALVKSRFIEMFGDPIRNPLRMSVSSVEELAAPIKNSMKAGPFGSALKKEVYAESGYKVYGQEQVISGNQFLGNYYIDKEKYEQLNSCKVMPGDVLISLVGTVGKVLILSEDCQPGIINPRLVKIAFDKRKIFPEYFAIAFSLESVRSSLLGRAHGQTMNVLNLGMIKKLKLPVPPISRQKEYLNFVAQVDKSRFGGMLRLLNSLSGIMHASFFSVADTD